MCPLQNHLKTANGEPKKNPRKHRCPSQLLGFGVALSRFWRSRWFGLEGHGVATKFWVLFFSKPKLQSLGWLELFLQNWLVVSPTPFEKICCSSNWIILAQVIWVKNRKYVRNHHSLSFMVFFGVFKLSFPSK